VVTAPGVDVDDALALAGALEATCTHPVAVALTEHAAARVAFWPAVYDVTVHDGRGVTGETGARSALVGNPAALAERGVAVPTEIAGAVLDAAAHDHTAVVLAWDGVARAVFVLADTVRAGSAAAVARLRGWASSRSCSPATATRSRTPSRRRSGSTR